MGRWRHTMSRGAGWAAIIALAFWLAGCGFFGGGAELDATQVAGVAVTPTGGRAVKPTVIPLTNENWDLAVKDADRYRGSPVDITGQIFNAIGDYEGASHYQLFTDPRNRGGNTHLAVPPTKAKLPMLSRIGWGEASTLRLRTASW